MIKHIIFDFDGTIADSGDFVLEIVNQLSDKYRYKKVTVEDLAEFKNMPIKKRLKRIGLPLYKVPKCLMDASVIFKNLINSLKIFDGMKDEILKLKDAGLTLSIISSNSVDNIQSFLKTHDLEVFDNVISAKNIFGKHKAIKRFLKKFKLKTDDVFYIGDELRDIESCKIVSLRIISVAWGYDTVELLQSGSPDFVAYKPADLMKIISIQNSL